MSNFLRVGRDSNFYLNGNLVNTQDVKNINEYFMGFLGFNTTLEDGITLSELIHAVYGLKQYISSYHLEEYEVLRAFTHMGKFNKPYKAIEISKSFTVESDEFLDEDSNYLCVTPVVDLVECIIGDVGYDKIGDIPVIVNENMKLVYNENTTLELKAKFTLQDIITCLYEELLYKIKNDNLVSYAV